MSEVRGDDPEWFFFDGGPGSPRYGDDPTKHAVEHDTETFVREVIQNANDERVSTDDPVRVDFELVELTGSERNEFLDDLGWDDGLYRRLKAVSKMERGDGYDRFLNGIDDGEPLRLLVVSDANTTGLTGGWDEDSNYAALVRDELFSNKQQDTAGGSYGLGKSVLWTFSEASTVLFHSTPGWGDSASESIRRRLIGRTKLPTHRLDSDGPAYQGAGWYCRPTRTGEGRRPEAITGNSARKLAEQLHIARDRARGTSMAVVGFGDPTRDDQRSLEKLVDEFRRSAVKYFWPAMCRDDLAVTVTTQGESHEATVRDVPSIEPFVDAYRDRFDEAGLETPGDVSGVDIDINPPPLADGTDTEKGRVRLGTRFAAPTDDDTLLNYVALFRGSGMVVKYLDQSRVAYSGRNFFSVLACGEARLDVGPTEADSDVDRLLRAAEPPDHDDWTSTENLRNQYQRGYRKTLDRMFDDLREALRYQLSRNDRRGETLSESVLRQFPIHGGLSRGGGTKVPDRVFDLSGHSSFEAGQWRIEGAVEPLAADFEEWSVTLSLRRMGEEGRALDGVPIKSCEADRSGVTVTVEDGTAELVGDAGGRTEFTGVSIYLGDGGAGGEVAETRLEVEAELVEEGSR